jgi:DeoR/GlpR family transcriptional regulator of sugar metabolism
MGLYTMHTQKLGRYSMDSNQRRRQVLALARTNGSVEVSRLASALHVSPETVRRDLRQLEEQGLLRRTHGGAYPVESAGFEIAHATRATRYVREKTRIAAAAVGLIQDAETIFIDEGFTPQLVAQSLPQARPFTVITTSLNTSLCLAPRSDIRVFQLGGRVRGAALAAVGEDVTRTLSRFVIDVAFISANGVSRKFGMTTPDPSVSEVKACAITCSRRRILVGISAKFGAVSFSRFAHVDDFEAIVTDARLPTAEAHRYAMLGPNVLRV